MAEQFCLRWNNHQSTLVSVFENLLESETLTDCTLAAEGRYLKAHKVVLSACSPYFETILCQHYDKHPIVVLKDVKYYEMRAMLDYMYRGEVNISQDQLDAFIKTAESLQIKGLTDQGGGGGTSCDSDERDVGSTKRKGSPFKSDIAPESPLVGNTPLREGSTSPSSLKRRRRQRHTSQGNGEVPDSHVDTSNSCDIPPQMLGTAPPVPNKSVTAAATSSSSHPLQSSTPELGRLPVKKTEPPDIIQPKIEMDDHSDDVEDLTLDDDEDYGGESDLSKPGTSYSGPAGQGHFQESEIVWRDNNLVSCTASNTSGGSGILNIPCSTIQNPSSQTPLLNTPDGRKICCKSNPHMWKRNLNRVRRLKGEEYINTKGKLISARSIRPPPCQNRRNHLCSDLIPEDGRKFIFDEFHSLETFQSQREYLVRHIIREKSKRKTVSGDSRKAFTKKYFLSFNGQPIPVCREFFLCTLGISEGLIIGAFKKLSPHGIIEPDRRGGKKNSNKEGTVALL